MICFRLDSRCGVPTAPRKYLLVTMFVALIDQVDGNSTPRCSKLIVPSRQFVSTTSRRSQVTSSYGCTPGVVYKRSSRSPLPLSVLPRRPLPALPAAEPEAVPLVAVPLVAVPLAAEPDEVPRVSVMERSLPCTGVWSGADRRDEHSRIELVRHTDGPATVPTAIGRR